MYVALMQEEELVDAGPTLTRGAKHLQLFYLRLFVPKSAWIFIRVLMIQGVNSASLHQRCELCAGSRLVIEICSIGNQEVV